MKHILVLEDDSALITAIEHQLSMRGFSPVIARTVEEGLSVIDGEEHIDAIWLDHYLLGKQNGLDFVARLKGSEHTKNIPVFVVSNSAGAESMTSYMRLGVEQYYTKADYDLSQIINDISYALENAQ
ncbi:MAG: response regulator [Candidatus Yonathbacteria bacterium]|nr:response regulator [Candidatus Yonathbacteria bacterium]NTW47925.1 response regulator [Candidatus Yonathbacteria bacterium]